ncbi:MAG: lysostaphin resistance A-like protein [Actinomycetota bacterium]
MTTRAPADYPGCPATVSAAESAGVPLVAPRWGIPDALITVALSVVLAVIAGVVALVWDLRLGIAVIAGIVAPWIGLLGWPLLCTRLRGNGPRIDLGLRLTWSDVGLGVGVGFLGLLLAGAIALLTQGVVGEFNSAAGEIALELQDEGTLAMFAFAVAVMVGAPIVEEIAFRGMVFNSLRKRGLSAVWTIAVTALVFAAFHLEPVRFFILLPIGVLYGWLRWRTGALGAPIIAHMVNNGPAAVVLLLVLPEVTP